LHAFLFWTIAVMTGFCAVAVVVSQNIAAPRPGSCSRSRSASEFFFLLGADLVGAIQAVDLCRRHAHPRRLGVMLNRPRAVYHHEDQRRGVGHERRRWLVLLSVLP